MFRGLSTASLPVVSLFSSPFLFAVPAYQRPYSWTTKEAKQLLDDIVLAAGLDDEAAREPDYFLGTILVLDPESDGVSAPTAHARPRVHEVVDGQQRLVTLTILACVLRDYEDSTNGPTLPPQDTTLRDRLDAMARVDRGDRDLASWPTRVQLRGAEQEFLDLHICSPHPRDSHNDLEDGVGAETLRAVFAFFMRELETMTHDERGRLAVYLIEQCHVVVIVTRDIDRAHRLFTVLNERGKPLDRQDILKVEVLRGVAPAFGVEAVARWDRAAQQLGPKMDSLIGHIRFIHARTKQPVISGMRTLVQRMGSQRFLTEVFTPLADALTRVHEHNHYPAVLRSSKLCMSLGALHRMTHSDWVPAAMLAMKGTSSDPQRTADLIVAIERLTYALAILGLAAGKRVQRFAKVTDAIKADPSAALKSDVFDISRDESKAIAFRLRDLHRRNAALSKLVLMRIEDELAGEPLLVNPSDLSVEHVLPSRTSPSSDWRRDFPDAEQRAVCLQSLGNLALMSQRKNERAKNNNFPVKLAIYLEPEFGEPKLVFNREIFEAQTWTATQIKAREAHALQVLTKVWRLDCSGSNRSSPPSS
jgi:Protein of unknown function DUF262/Protein of unknown function (DUF1524)